ncbi:uncharacterized protein L201_007861 [Kwoniella dendrophila CBS 6074]|uniref:DUF2428 domain-containing protein n=1 Tax=Kwoniella dendrophila CBS 6074 TaxID=1295534 RepID=A0AAX4K6Z9_9TREE
MDDLIPKNEGKGDLESCRKALVKARSFELEDGDLINQGIDLVLSTHPPALHLKQLELLLIILRHLTNLSSTLFHRLDVSSNVHEQLIPAFQPSGHLASLILANLDSPLKVQQQRASEVLSLAGHLSNLLPAPSASASVPTTFMVPFFTLAINGGISRRSNLTIISSLLDYIPTSAIPENLVDNLLEDLPVVDCSIVRSNLIVNLLLKLSSTEPEDQRQSSVLKKVLPYFDPELPHAVMVTMNRYFLPALFKEDPSYVPTLLESLSRETELFGAWITVASLGVSLGLVKINELSREDLKDALSHEDTDIRMRAFELVSSVTKDQFNEEILELVKEGFMWNDALPSAGSRSTFSSTTYAFLVKLHQLETLAKRVNRKKPNTDKIIKEQESLNHVLPLCESFHRWFLIYLDKGLIQARRFPVFKILLSLNLLGRYLDVFGDTENIHENVFTQERVEMLLNCQMSEFTEVRLRSRKILESAKIPLPSYESLSTPSSQALLQSALNSINLPRKTQAEAGKSALCILFIKLIRDDKNQNRALEFVGDLINQLETGIEAVEEDLVKGIEEYPLHGSLAAVGDLLSCLDLTSVNAQDAWQPTFHQLFTLIERIWKVTRTVISLAPSVVEGAANASRPDHEIARAYEVLDGADEEEDGEGGEGMDHTGLLSGCWRATRNAGELLATIVSLPINQSGASQTVWTKEGIDTAGQCFLTWMHEIRHRGTFSKIATAFAQLVEAVRPIPNLRGLCEEWLQHELKTIASDQHSTTRRSAGLPYSILSLVSSDEQLINTALTALLDLARVDNGKTSNITKVHSFNVLKIVMLDARQTKWFSQWFEKGVMTALGAFESEDWNVRNVGLILFSTLVHRCLSPPRSGQDLYKSRTTLSTRHSFSSFHAKYPLVIPFITKYLEQHNHNRGNRHSPLFPILIIIRSLRYDGEAGGLVKGLRVTVERYLSSKEHQVRPVVAQALSSLIAPAHSFDIALAISTSHEKSDMNTIHGQMLYLRQLIASVIPWHAVPTCSKQSFEEQLLLLVQRFVPGICPPITQAVLGCVKAYKQNTPPQLSELTKQTSVLSAQYLTNMDNIAFTPGEDARHIAFVEYSLSHGPTEDSVLGLLSKSATETDHEIALHQLPSLAYLWTTRIFDQVLEIGLAGRGGDGVRALALDVLSEVSWSCKVLQGMTKRLRGVMDKLRILIKNQCVPVKEAALVVLGWAVNQAIITGDISATDGLNMLSNPILAFSQEDESQPSRYSALQSLSHLAIHIFRSPNPVLHQTLVRLVQDDDEEIRVEASDIIRRGLNRKRGVVQSKSLEIYWQWLGQYLESLSDAEREKWLIWITDLSLDKQGYEQDLEMFNRHTNSTEVLFEVEPSNIFRDPLVDLYYSNKILKNLKVNSTISETTKARKETQIRNISPEGKDVSLSPIDDAWETKRTLVRRKEYQA